MEEINKRQESLGEALLRFCESFENVKAAKGGRFYEGQRDSSIKRFELCVDLFWKVLKDFIAAKHGIFVASPKSVVRESLKQSIINENELLLLIKMIDDRNLTSHTYDEVLAEDILKRLPEFYTLMNQIFLRLNN